MSQVEITTTASTLGRVEKDHAILAVEELPFLELSTLSNSSNQSLFSKVPLGLVDPDEVLKRRVEADLYEGKIDLTAGVFKKADSPYFEFEAIRKAKQILASNDPGHNYIPIFGIPAFREEAQKLVFGAENARLKRGEIATLQTIAGCGANRIGAAFLKHHFPMTFPSDGPSENSTKLYIGTPGWRNHIPLFTHAGFNIETYEHYDPVTREANLPALLEAIKNAPQQSIFVLQVCCHNPTGVDFTQTQWKAIAQEMRAKEHFPFFDFCYGGYGSDAADGGESDAWPIRYFSDLGFDMIVAHTFSKSMSLYGERLGSLHFVCQSPAIAECVLDQARCFVRWEYSSPPGFAARLVSIVLKDPGLKDSWRKELAANAASNRENRVELHHLLSQKFATPGNWDFILNGSGMFSFLPLSAEQVNTLGEKFHVWMPDNGRLNLAGLNKGNIGIVAAAINSVVRT